MQGHSAQMGHIQGDKGGLVGMQDPKTIKIKKLGKDSDTDSLIGGIGANDKERFHTTYARQAAFEGTSRDQLTIEKQMGRKKIMQDPAQSKSSLVNPFEVQVKRPQAKPLPEVYQPSVVGKSLISNLGSDLVNLVPPLKK